ncbi:hypothetical protein IMZ11_02585 [Microtetraspora sp. AC03309]|uniref:hypothetical protein n=1 Tax=Microtetraspora sp. AC03309 TaxID=2779376 RepID=UPI001E5E4A9B|nr:hypothetical protein [Microtetraspora sp. AC03309]MCC5574526.1 hypothetical protein [Microtetraspora sp. AC03309]
MPETPDLRQRYADALSRSLTSPQRGMADHLDAVMAVRDDELARLRREVAYVAETGERWRQLWERVDQERSDAVVRAEQDTAANARVRAKHVPFQRGDDAFCDECSVSHESGVRRYVLVPFPCDTIAALDQPAAVSEEQAGGGNG